MHEFSLAAALLELVAEDAHKHRARTVTRVVVRIGILSGVVPELFEEAFHVCKRATVAGHAVLQIERQEVLIACSCGYRGAITDMRFVCPRCDNRDIEVTAGEDMILQQLEMDIEDSPA